MANFKRKRPHKHPRSVMSSPDRVFESRDTGVAEIAEQLDEFEDNGAPPAPRQKKKRRKRYGIESRLKAEARCHPLFRRWSPRSWYETESQRNAALRQLQKCHRNFEFRPVSR